MPILTDLTGKEFKRLTVMSRGPNEKFGGSQWWCLCDCGNGVLAMAANLKTGNTNSCGCLHKERATERCRARRGRRNPWYGVSRYGVVHPAWKGGHTPERKQIQNSVEYKQWRKVVFERDRYVCQKCNVRGGNLNAHHIEAFAGNPELRTKLSNGVTLCENCHKNFHHQFGYSSTKQQLDQFMNGE